jgi:hypothetical protein
LIDDSPEVGVRPGGVVNVLVAGALGATASSGLRGAVPERAPSASVAAAPAPAPVSEVSEVVEPVEAAVATNGVARREADPRPDLAHERVAWLALEGHPAGALLEADRLRELGSWLRPDDVRRLLELAQGDALEARRRAAFVALGHVRPASAAHIEALTAAWQARPSEESRLGLLEALLALRHAGAPVEAGLELVLAGPASASDSKRFAGEGARPFVVDRPLDGDREQVLRRAAAGGSRRGPRVTRDPPQVEAP